MKRIVLSAAVMAGALMLSGCGTTGSTSLLQGVGQALLQGAGSNSSMTQSNSQNGTELLSYLLNGVLGNSMQLNERNLQGTWHYIGTDCVFDSENLLAQAGGALAARKIETELNAQLAKVGIQEGACTFTFNRDNTYSAQIGRRTIEGEYYFDPETHTLEMTYLRGLAKLTPQVAMKGGKLSLLFESDKLLSMIKGISALSGSTSTRTLSSLLNNYNGLHIGLQLSK